MLTFNDVLQLYSGFDYDKLLSIAKKSAEKFLPACRKVEKCPYGDLIFTFILFSVFKVDFYLYDRVTGAIRTMPESESFQRFSAFRD